MKLCFGGVFVVVVVSLSEGVEVEILLGGGGGHWQIEKPVSPTFLFLRLPRVGQNVPVLRHDADADFVGAALDPEADVHGAWIGNSRGERNSRADKLERRRWRRRRRRNLPKRRTLAFSKRKEKLKHNSFWSEKKGRSLFSLARFLSLSLS